jgi:PhoPQ-activated pathogenicity-related protein
MKAKLSLLTLVLLMISCKTYTISPENFKKQIIDSNANNLKDAKVNNPLSQFSSIEYKANSLKYLNVYDKKGSLSFMQNSPSVEMRVTLKNGK